MWKRCDMADITKCKGTGCPLKNKCYRHMANTSYWQSWFVEVPYKSGKCDEFWNNDAESSSEKEMKGEEEMVEFVLKEVPFDWNDNLSGVALEDFSLIQKDLPYCTCQTIGMALAKLELLEQQGAIVKKEQKNENMTRHCVNCPHDKSVCEQLKGCVVENDKKFDDEQEALKHSYEQGRADALKEAKDYIFQAIGHDGRNGWSASTWKEYIGVCFDELMKGEE